MNRKWHPMAKNIAHLMNEQTEIDIHSNQVSINQVLTQQDIHWLQSLLPYRRFSEGIFINEQSMGFVLETSLLVGLGDKTEKDLLTIFQTLLPVGSSLQVLLIVNHHIEPWLKGWSQRHPHATYQRLMESRCQYYRNHTFLEMLNVRHFRLFWSYSKPIDKTSSMKEVQMLQTQLKSIFSTMNMWVESVSPSQLLSLLHTILCPSKALYPSSFDYNPHQILAQQLQVPSVKYEVHPDALWVKTKDSSWAVQSYHVRRYPTHWSLAHMQQLIGDGLNDARHIPCPFLIHYGISILSPSQKEKYLLKAMRVESQAMTWIGKIVPSIRKEAQEWGYVRPRLEQGDRFISTQLSVTLYPFPDTKERAEQKLLSLFQGCGFELMHDKYLQLPFLLSQLPMQWGEGWFEAMHQFKRTKTTLSSEAVHCLPIQGEWQGTKTPAMLLAGRRGQLFYWSPFDNNHGNYNVCVVGRSGSGKSVFMQDLMTSTLRLNGRVFVLDVGRSFEKTCHLLHGSYIAFNRKEPLSINPFTHMPIDSSMDALSLLKPVLSMMAAPIQGTNDKQNALLEQALIETWQRYQRENTITHVAKWLLQQKDETAHDLGLMLFPYTKEGAHGAFFEKPASVDLTNPLVVIELEALKEKKELQAVVLQMMMINITNQMLLGDRKTPFNIVIDEAWDMLKGSQTGLFIETLARRLRKYQGSLVVGTQSVHDFYQTPATIACFDNSDWLCLLSQKKESIRALKESQRLVLDDPMERCLESITTKSGQYAETMLYGPHGYTVGRLMLDPFSLLLYSTKAEDFVAVQTKVQLGLSIVDAIDEVLKERACSS